MAATLLADVSMPRRGLDVLRERLARRGVALSVGLLAALAASIEHRGGRNIAGNGLSVLATMGLEGGNDLLVGNCGLAGFLVLVVANLGLGCF